MKNDNEILKHMLEDILDILQYTEQSSFSDFVSNSMMRKAVCMSLINIGELAKSLSTSFKSEHRNIPEKNIA